MKHALTLYVVALLQLCGAEISEALPEWYSVNLIKDGNYQPKPITEIFTTPPTFTSTKPITVIFTTPPTFTSTNPVIVESTSSTSETEDVFTVPTTMSETTSLESSPFTKDPTRTFMTLQQNTSTLQRTQEEERQREMYQTRPEQIQVLLAQLPQIQPDTQLKPVLQSDPLIQPGPQAQPVPQIQSDPLIQPGPQAQPVPQIQSVFQTIPPQQIPRFQSTSQQQSTGQPNYFLIYQQAPLSIPQYPESGSQLGPSSPASFQASTQQPVTQKRTQGNIQPTTVTQPTVIIREIRTEKPQTTSTSSVSQIIFRNRDEPLFFTSAPLLFGGPWQDPSISPGNTFSSSPISSTVIPNSDLRPGYNEIDSRFNRTIFTPLPQETKIPALTIRVTAPRGSITNIKINPTATTKRSSTRRSQRRKGNNYNACTESCKGKKEPICGAPLAVIPIDPNKLRGFPSICHLACHNSFRKKSAFRKNIGRSMQ